MTPQPRSKYDAGRQAAPLLDRIRSKCRIEGECWIWTGATVKGYGRTKVGSRRDGSRRSKSTHIATWEAVHGPVPAGLTLDHVACNRPLCCNPEHLAPATIWENTQRSLTSPTAVNARKEACPKCGGPYSITPRGTRSCNPCRLAYFRTYNATRRAPRRR